MKTPLTIEEIDQEAAKKKADLLKKAAIYALIPDSMEGFNVFVCSTSYTADMFLKIDKKGYGGDPTGPTADTIRQLAEVFQPLPLKKLKGWATTIMPAAKYDAWTEEKKDREVKEEEDLAPFVVEVEPAQHSRNLSVVWFAQTSEGILNVEVDFDLHLCQWLGTSTVRYSGNNHGDKWVAADLFTINNETTCTLFDAEDTPVADRSGIIKWATGSREYPSKRTVHWAPLSASPVPIEALARIITLA